MATNPHLTTTGVGGAWVVSRPDGYRLKFEHIDTTQPRSWKAQVTSYLQDTELLTASIDLLNLRDRTMYHQAAAAMNGQHACAWDQFLMQSYRGIQARLAEHDRQEAQRQRQVGGTPVPDTPLAPPLPKRASLRPALADGAAPWLEAYIGHSATWSPRAADNFHAAAGLWMLSTVAAGRIAVELGDPIYPNLFLALVSRSTLYAKTTTAKISKRGLRQAGCGPLLAADRATPQALLRSMSGAVPEHFGDLDDAAQLAVTQRLAFAAQRGWHYEEWGGMLHQMTRKDSPVAEFHGILRWMDDGDETFESDTIARGLERLARPYLALLCNATPHDLAQFMRPGSNYWHDGFWPRFAFITPRADELPSRRRQPAGSASLPRELVTPLQQWHQRLGISRAHVAPVEQNGKPTGRYKALVEPLPCQWLTLAPDVLEAYYAYNDALLEMIIDGTVAPDLDASYGRFHMKALRIALLLASIADSRTVTLQHWAYAQTVAEQWRRMLHQLVETVAGAMPLTREEILEDKIERELGRHSNLTAREVRHAIWGSSSREIYSALDAMSKVGRVIKTPEGKTFRYSLPGDSPANHACEEDTKTEEIPF